ncbi:MAG: type I pullulanase, partial [Alistipes sp.]|nr:type I pullulanase [Alistipes sp.]
MKTSIKIAAIMLAISTLAACSSADTTGDWPVPEQRLCEMDYTPSKTTFSLWAPTADEVEVRLYDNGALAETIAMKPAEACMWTATKEGDQIGKQYTFRVKIDGEWLKETPG